MKKILVATDGSAASTDAVAFAVELASEHQSELTFVHVVPTADVITRIDVALPHEPTAHDHALLTDAAAIAAERAVSATTALLRGQPLWEIVWFADAHDVDLTIAGSRGHGAVASALLGGVSRGVVRESGARCSSCLLASRLLRLPKGVIERRWRDSASRRGAALSARRFPVDRRLRGSLSLSLSLSDSAQLGL